MNGDTRYSLSNGSAANGLVHHMNGDIGKKLLSEEKNGDVNTGTNDMEKKENGILDTHRDATQHSINSSVTNSWYCSLTLLATMASTMMSIGLAVGALNPSMTLLTGFFNKTWVGRHQEPISLEIVTLLLSLTVSMLLLGGLLGALSLGLILRFLTRKQGMVLINIINVFAVTMSSAVAFLIQSYELIIIGRLLMGFVSGVAMNLVPMVISECSTKRRAPLYLSLIGVNLSLGGLIGLLFGLDMVFGNDDHWPILLAIPSAPSIVYIMASPWLPESPSYLLLNNRKQEAMRTLEKLRLNPTQSSLQEEVAAIKREQETQHQSSQSISLKEMITTPGYRWQLFLVVMVFLESEFCGINAISMYTNKIFDNARISPEYVTYASLIVYFVQFLTSLAGSIAVDRWGAKRLTVFMLIIMGLSMFLLTISAAKSENSAMPYVSVVAVAIYTFSWATGPNITLFPLITGLTTETTREASFKLGGSIFWLSSWFVGFIPPYLMAGLKAYAYVIWGVFNIFFAVFFFFKIPEMRGKSPEQIQEEIHARNPRDSNDISMQPLQPI